MPVRHRKEKSRALDKWQRAELLFGPCLLAGCGYHQYADAPSRDTSRMKSDWERNRETLMAEFIAAYPGERPYAWWLFDAPREPVRQIESLTNYLRRHGLLIDADHGRPNGAALHIGNSRPDSVTDERAG